MKKLIVRALAITLALFLLCGGAALGESKYVSIKDIRDTVPERWTGEYTTKKGKTVSIDAPIVVPEVDTVPIVRITWGGPYEWLNEAIDSEENSKNYSSFTHSFLDLDYDYNTDLYDTTVGNRVTWEDASNVLLAALIRDVPAMKDRSLACHYQAVIPTKDYSEGLYHLSYYNAFHGISYLIGQNFRLEVESEHLDELPSVPYNQITCFMLDSDHYMAWIGSPKEIGVDIEDVPLLSFDEVLKAFEQLAQDGYIYSLDELRFGYMAFIDPDKKGEEFVLMPVWAAKGRTNNDPTIPFDLKTSQVVLDYNGYLSGDVLVINAQNGKFYEFAYDTSPDRRYVPSIITWDDVR
ncbi:MAG: hypothetical protein PHY12_00825 [Eubacteriales bacterium]|nr:hypothetical protein [Eubacteriales bacterium]